MATHLARALSGVADVVAVASRGGASACRLAERIGGGCKAVGLDLLPDDADLYLIAVSDDAVAEVAASTPDYPGIWAHTSGSVPVDALSGCKSRSGVFYPLQTFTRDVDVDVAEVPFFIEGSDSDTGKELMKPVSYTHLTLPTNSRV